MVYSSNGYLEFKGDSFLVVVDCMSHFPELRLIKRKTAAYVIIALKAIFSIHGVPMSIIADNMTFGSHAMAVFAKLLRSGTLLWSPVAPTIISLMDWPNDTFKPSNSL